LAGSQLDFTHLMKKIAIAVLVGICLPLLAAFLFVDMGGMPVATKGNPLPLEHLIAHIAVHRAMGSAPDQPSPIPADEANLLAGARVYTAQQCNLCHGLSTGTLSATAKGLFPAPPPLLRTDKKGVTGDSAGESYWKIKNGMRLTGMPGYVDSLSDTELWQVSLLLHHAHDLPPAVKAALTARLP
jgi:mono/diheme cytochrome c family protein